MMTKVFDDDHLEHTNMRLTKPMIEKRRRARINHCLIQLKEMVIDSGKQKIQNPKCRYEKADILEFTVAYVKQLQHNKEISSVPQSVPMQIPRKTDSPPLILSSIEQSYTEGFIDCAKEVQKFLTTNDISQIPCETIIPKLMLHLEEYLHQSLVESNSIKSEDIDQMQHQLSSELPHQRVIRHTSECESPLLTPSQSSSGPPSPSRFSPTSTISRISSLSLESSIASPFASEFVPNSDDIAPLNLVVYGNERNGHCYQVMDIDCVWRPW